MRKDKAVESEEKVKHFYNDKLIQNIIFDFFSTPLPDRLDKLSVFLEKKDPQLAAQIKDIKTEVERNGWGRVSSDGRTIHIGESHTEQTGVKDQGSMPGVQFYVDTHIEMHLASLIRTLLYQMMVEGLVGTGSPVKYQEHMRLAAGLPFKVSAKTEKFLTRLHERLVSDHRKKWLSVHPGGSTSPLTRYGGAICFHYEQLHPIWKEAKKIFKQHGGDAQGHAAVAKAYSKLGEGEPWAKTKEQVGLLDKLIEKLASSDPYDSSPEYLAYEHAAVRCGFKVGQFSVRQIKRVANEYKRR